MVHLLLLPGMDGTGRLFEPLVLALPDSMKTTVVSYPRGRTVGHLGLVELAAEQMPRDQCMVVAESFSGPIGVTLASRFPGRVGGVLLVASFLRNPLPWPLSPLVRIGHPWMFSVPPPEWALRSMLVGSGGSTSTIDLVRETIAAVPARVLAARVRSIAKVDATCECRRLRCPVAYLEGSADRLVGARGARQVAEALPGSEHVSLDAPHLVLQARPAASAAILRDLTARWVDHSPAGDR